MSYSSKITKGRKRNSTEDVSDEHILEIMQELLETSVGISLATVLELRELLHRKGINPTREHFDSIMSISDKCLSPYYDSFLYLPNGIRNQEALGCLISSLEAMDVEGQFSLTKAFCHKIASSSKSPSGTKPHLTFRSDTLLEVARSFANEKPVPHQEILRESFFQEMMGFFENIGLDSKEKDAALFNEWMTVIFSDPVFEEVKEEDFMDGEARKALLEEKLPDTVRGKKVADVYAELRERKDASLRSEWEKYPDFLKKYFKRNPMHKITDGRRACAKKFGKGLRTIERHTKGYKIPPTG